MRTHAGTLLCLAICSTFLPSTFAQTFTTLHTFENTEGANPQAALVQDSAGNLYSTAQYGGAYQSGTAFRLAPSGTLTVLHNFGYPSSDGARPQGPLLIDSHNNFYGTTIRQRNHPPQLRGWRQLFE